MMISIDGEVMVNVIILAGLTALVLAQMAGGAGGAVAAGPLSVALTSVSVEFDMTDVCNHTFCFRRWHSVQETNVLWRFLGGALSLRASVSHAAPLAMMSMWVLFPVRKGEEEPKLLWCGNPSCRKPYAMWS